MLAERDIIFQKKINKIADQQKIIMQQFLTLLEPSIFFGGWGIPTSIIAQKIVDIFY